MLSVHSRRLHMYAMCGNFWASSRQPGVGERERDLLQVPHFWVVWAIRAIRTLIIRERRLRGTLAGVSCAHLLAGGMLGRYRDLLSDWSKRFS